MAAGVKALTMVAVDAAAVVVWLFIATALMSAIS
jgi:hypothetical protein